MAPHLLQKLCKQSNILLILFPFLFFSFLFSRLLQGVVCLIQVVSGALQEGRRITTIASVQETKDLDTKTDFSVQEVKRHAYCVYAYLLTS